MASNPRSFSQSSYVMDIGGQMVGYIKKASGGKYTWDVHESKLGSDLITKKMITNHKIDAMSVECGIAMGKALYQWIRESFDKAHSRRSGAIIIADADFKAKRRIEFFEALVTEFSTPKLDAAGKEAGYLTLKFQPELTKFGKGSGDISATIGQSQKLWMTNNFRLDIGGLDCSTVQSVEAFKWEQKTVVNAYGHIKDNELIPTGLTCGDLSFNIGPGEEAKVEDDWMQKLMSWHSGASTEKDHRSGTLTFLAQDMSTELGSISFEGLGFKSFQPPDLERGEKARSIKIEMYCEHAVWNPSKTDA